MKVSVITVCRNAATTIGHTLRSVQAQDYPDIEHIVVDGGSSDGTQDIVGSLNSRVAYFVSETDRGIYDAMNRGIAVATGDVIGFLNADDVYASPRVVSTIADAMADPSIAAVFGDVEYTSGVSGRPVRRYISRRFSPDTLRRGWMPAHPTLYLRRTIYERFGPMRTDYEIAADFEYVARVFKGGTVPYRYLDQVLVRMRVGGVSSRGLSSGLVRHNEILRALRENGIRSSHAALLLKYFLKLSELRLR